MGVEGLEHVQKIREKLPTVNELTRNPTLYELNADKHLCHDSVYRMEIPDCPQLKMLIERWEQLPVAIKRAIEAIVKSATR